MKRILYPILILTTLAVARQPLPLPEPVLFRTASHAYQLLPAEDLGLEGVFGAQVLNERTLLIATRRSGGLRSSSDQPASAGELAMALFDINTRRRIIPVGDGFDANLPFQVDFAEEDSAILRYYTTVGVPTPRFWLNFGTRRVTRIPNTITRPIPLPGMRLMDIMPEELVIYNSRGEETARHPIPPAASVSGTGTNPDEVLITRKPADNSVIQFLTLNVRTGELKELSREELTAQFKNQTPVEYRLIPVPIPGEPFETKQTAWRLVPGSWDAPSRSASSNEIPKPHELPRGCTFAAGAQQVEMLSPTLLLITRDERLAIQRIEEASLEDYEAFVRREVQREAMNNTKMSSTAAMIYASDYGGRFPLGNYADSLVPYTKDRSVLDGMTFVFNGQNLKDMQAPAETVIGWKDTAYGRAIAYGDGSVRWRPNP